MTVTFCVHKDIANTYTVRAAVDEVLRGLVAEGADYFLIGGYGGFDSLAAHTVHELKRQYPEIHSTLVIPYLNREYNTELYDNTTYPPPFGRRTNEVRNQQAERMDGRSG